jgi:hypothetical protein
MDEVKSSEFESDDLLFDEYWSSLLPALEPLEFQEDGSGIVNFKSKGSKHDKVMVSIEWLSAILLSTQTPRMSRPSVLRNTIPCGLKSHLFLLLKLELFHEDDDLCLLSLLPSFPLCHITCLCCNRKECRNLCQLNY